MLSYRNRLGYVLKAEAIFEDTDVSQAKAVADANTYAYESEPLVKPTGFREYDARWLLGKEINLMGVQALGMGLGTLIRELGVRPKIVTGHDFRGYSASVRPRSFRDCWRLAARCTISGLRSRRWPISRSSSSTCRASLW